MSLWARAGSRCCSSTLYGNARRDTPDQGRSRDPFDYTKNPFWNRPKSVLTEPNGTASTCGFRITHQPRSAVGVCPDRPRFSVPRKHESDLVAALPSTPPPAQTAAHAHTHSLTPSGVGPGFWFAVQNLRPGFCLDTTPACTAQLWLVLRLAGRADDVVSGCAATQPCSDTVIQRWDALGCAPPCWLRFLEPRMPLGQLTGTLTHRLGETPIDVPDFAAHKAIRHARVVTATTASEAPDVAAPAAVSGAAAQ